MLGKFSPAMAWLGKVRTG